MKYAIVYKMFIAASIWLISGCSQSSKNKQNEAIPDDDLIHITAQNFASENMQIGEVSEYSFDETIECNGFIEASPNDMAQISSHLSGTIDLINCSVGDYVKKGQVLLQLSTTELIVLQQDYIKTAALIKKVKAEYHRRKILYDENIGTEKEFLAIESEYKGIQADYKSLKLQLQLLKLNVTQIESGKLYSFYPIVAPIAGYITNLNTVLGQFIEKQTNILEIVDVSQLQLHLSVYEQDINKLKIGNPIRFSLVNETDQTNLAALTAISRTIDQATKTIICRAKIKQNTNTNFNHGAYVNAKIIIDTRTSRSLPKDAFLKKGKSYYVFAIKKQTTDGLRVQKVELGVGRFSKDSVELLDSNFNDKVLVSGIYNLPIE